MFILFLFLFSFSFFLFVFVFVPSFSFRQFRFRSVLVVCVPPFSFPHFRSRSRSRVSRSRACFVIFVFVFVRSGLCSHDMLSKQGKSPKLRLKDPKRGSNGQLAPCSSSFFIFGRNLLHKNTQNVATSCEQTASFGKSGKKTRTNKKQKNGSSLTF